MLNDIWSKVEDMQLFFFHYLREACSNLLQTYSEQGVTLQTGIEVRRKVPWTGHYQWVKLQLSGGLMVYCIRNDDLMY